MAVNYILPAHLAHLVRIHVAEKDPQRDGLLVRAVSHDIGNRIGVLDFLETQVPGLREQLSRVWAYRGARSVHLWTLPFLPKHVAKRFKKHLVPHSDSLAGQRGGADDVRVHSTRRTGDLLVVKMRLTKERSFTYEDSLQSTDITVDVPIEVDLNMTTPVAAVFGAYQDARQAMFGFADYAARAQVPRKKSPAQEQIFSAVHFTESNVKKLAERLSMPKTSMRGPDATGTVGERQLWGKRVGTRRVALPDAPEVKRQDDGVNNERHYNFTFTHDDGFEEVAEVIFHFNPNHPSIQFPVRASVLFIYELIGEVLTEAGVS